MEKTNSFNTNLDNIKIDPPKEIKDNDLMLVDYVIFFQNDLAEVKEFINDCKENKKIDIGFIHKYTKEDSYCVLV